MAMYPDYGYGPSAPDAMEGAFGSVFGVMFGFILIFYLLMFAFAVTNYVLTALSMYKIAKRRGIHHAWMAWVPVCDLWLLGSISDQYQYLVKQRVRNRRKILLGLMLGVFGVSILMMAILAGAVIGAAGGASPMAAGGAFGLVFLLYFALIGLLITQMVFQYIVLYDLFASCDPGNAVLYLVLSILLGVVQPFFLFACRNKDLGMPLRKARPEPVQIPQENPTVVVPQTPVCEPVAEAPETQETVSPEEQETASPEV